MIRIQGFALALALALRAASGEFINLGFEDPDPRAIGYPYANEKSLLSGWDTYLDTVGYNNLTQLFGFCVLFDDIGRSRNPDLMAVPLVGRFGLGVVPDAARTYPPIQLPPPYVQQRGTVPVDAKGLFFLWQGEDLRVFLGGQQVPVYPWEQRLTDDPRVPVHNYYAVHVEPWAGQEVMLRFEFRAFEYHAFPDWPGHVHVLDDLHFSAIPEPPPRWLLLAGLWWLAWRCGRARGAG
ncbi:MAG: hypothetical protein FJ387_21895 [Verrucomicrobia bacterium]|nr:hypothetical protein [Verrucomicrobiota bacterium]